MPAIISSVSGRGIPVRGNDIGSLPVGGSRSPARDG